ncbi:MAG: hypothetical protein HHAS10_04250 [Candidatus Altimarinota bacterium]
MFSRLIAFLLLLGISYVGAIFLAPDFIDLYGNKEVNEKIRALKRETELDRISNNSGTLLDKTKDIARPFIEQSKDIVNQTQESLNQLNTVVTEKSEQAKDVIESAQETYKKAQETKSKIEGLTNFGTGK